MALLVHERGLLATQQGVHRPQQRGPLLWVAQHPADMRARVGEPAPACSAPSRTRPNASARSSSLSSALAVPGNGFAR